MDKTVFEGTDDTISFIVLNKSVVTDDHPRGTPIPFISNGVTSMELYLSDKTFTSDTDALAYDDVGGIHIKLGKETGIIKDVAHAASLKVLDPSHPNGQVIIHPKLKHSNLTIEVVSVSTY